LFTSAIQVSSELNYCDKKKKKKLAYLRIAAWNLPRNWQSVVIV